MARVADLSQLGCGMDRYYACGLIPYTGRCLVSFFSITVHLMTMEEKAHDDSDPQRP